MKFDTFQWIAIGFLAFFGGWFILAIGREFYSYFDHSKWLPFAQPDYGATINSMIPVKVQYIKNGAKYKTTVTFSDGFIFVTHNTARSDRIFSYTISLDEEMKKSILENAYRAHAKAVSKWNKKHH